MESPFEGTRRWTGCLGENVGVRHSLVKVFDAQVPTVSELFASKADAQRDDLNVGKVCLILFEITRAVAHDVDTGHEDILLAVATTPAHQVGADQTPRY